MEPYWDGGQRRGRRDPDAHRARDSRLPASWVIRDAEERSEPPDSGCHGRLAGRRLRELTSVNPGEQPPEGVENFRD